jgi:hypothetical protein
MPFHAATPLHKELLPRAVSAVWGMALPACEPVRGQENVVLGRVKAVAGPR